MRKQKNKLVDPLPKQFSSYEEAADFWDSHDTGDYQEAFCDVKADIAIKGRQFEISVDEDVVGLLTKAARKKHLSIGHLASELLRRDLSFAAA